MDTDQSFHFRLHQCYAYPRFKATIAMSYTATDAETSLAVSANCQILVRPTKLTGWIQQASKVVGSRPKVRLIIHASDPISILL